MINFDRGIINSYKRHLIGKTALCTVILIATVIFETALGMVGVVEDLIDGIEYVESITGEDAKRQTEDDDNYIYCYIDRLTVLCRFDKRLGYTLGRDNENYLVKYTDSEGKIVYTTLNTFGLDKTDGELLKRLEDHFAFGAPNPDPLIISGCFMLFSYKSPMRFETLYSIVGETEPGFALGHYITYEYPDVKSFYQGNTPPYIAISVYLAEVTVLLYFIIKNLSELTRIGQKLKGPTIVADYYPTDEKRALSVIIKNHEEINQYHGGIVISLLVISLSFLAINLFAKANHWQIFMITSAVMLTALCIYLLTDVKRKRLFDRIRKKEQMDLTESIFVDIPDMKIADIYLGKDALYCKKKKWFIPYSSIVWVYHTYRRTGPYGMIDEFIIYICTDDGVRHSVYSDKYELMTLLNRIRHFDFHNGYSKEFDKRFKEYSKEKKKEQRNAKRR